MVDMAVVRLEREPEPLDSTQGIDVPAGDLPAPAVELWEILKLDTKQGCLECIQAGIVPGHLVVVFFAGSVDAEHGCLLGEAVVVGGDHAPVAVSSQVFGRKKRKGSRHADSTGVPPVQGPAPLRMARILATGAGSVIGGTERLRAVLDNQEVVPVCDLHDPRHGSRLSKQMDRHDGFGPWGNCRLDAVGIDVKVAGFDIHKDRGSAAHFDRFGGSEKGEGRGDDLVALPHPGGTQGDEQGVGAGIDRDGMPDPDKSGYRGLQFLHLGTHDESSVLHDTRIRRVQLLAQQRYLRR